VCHCSCSCKERERVFLTHNPYTHPVPITTKGRNHTMTNMSVEFPSEVAQRAKLLLPVKYDPYQDKKNPRLCYFGFDQDHNALLLIADDTKDLLDIFYFNDMIGASVGVELHGSEEPRVSKGSTGLDPLVMEKVHDDNVPTSMVPSDTQAAAMLTLYSYPRKDPSKDSFISSCTGRQSSTQPITKFDVSNPSRKTSLLHRYACHHTFQLAPTEELDDISTVVKAIQNLARPASSSSNGEGGKDRLLLIVNPFSGRKKGLEIFQTIVIPMLDQAGIDYDSVITTHAGHAEEVMIPKDEDVVDGISDISKYTGLVAIGGDGSVYEVLQGIKKRPDSEQVLQSLSIGHIGAGTSNGLSATLAHACDVSKCACSHFLLLRSCFRHPIRNPYTLRISPLRPPLPACRRNSQLQITLSSLPRGIQFLWTCHATRRRRLIIFPFLPLLGPSLPTSTLIPKSYGGWVGHGSKFIQSGEY